MGDIRGFMKYEKKDIPKQEVPDRIKHWNEFYVGLSDEELGKQGARCMDCGVPFCQSGCPIGNIIPDWNDLVYRNRWQEAIERLHRTNNFPEFTGRICPAPCENACVLAINEPAVTIKNIEVSIIDRAYEKGWIKPRPPKHRTGKKVAVVGSGPSGLACADQLNQAGHKVTLFEKSEKLGGLLTFGIPDFKLEKRIVFRRVKRMEDEGIVFKTGVHVGIQLSMHELRQDYDALVLCGGAEQPRELPIPGRDLEGVYQAMFYLPQQNRVNMGHPFGAGPRVDVKGKNVVVLGGGDTGSDCVGTANRQGAQSIKQFELLPEPPVQRREDNPWPQWAFIKRRSSSHEEGVEQDYQIMTKKLTGENGKLTQLHAVKLEFGPKDPKTGRSAMKEVPGSEFVIKVDVLLLAMGFTGPIRKGMIEEIGVELNPRGNVKTNNQKMTSVPGVFAAGDMARGQSLVVWAIQEGRNAARGVDHFLMGQTNLPLLT
jgi:glutamate synthase (NADPH) small chain